MTYFKVVRLTRDPDIFFSVSQDGRCKALLRRVFPFLRIGVPDVKTQVTYRRNQWTFSRPTLHTLGYDLLVFKNLEDAQDAIYEYRWCDYAIFEVDVICTKTNLPRIRKRDWMEFEDGKWPPGTIMAWGVKLGKQID